MLPTLSVLIPAKNEEKTIGKCLDSILNSDYPKDKLEILVNVNGSSDNTYEICKKYREIKSIKTPAKTSRAAALNELIEISKGDIIGIFDADTIADEKCLRNAVQRFSDESVMGVTGMTNSLKTNSITRAISIEKNINSFVEHIFSKLGRNAHFGGKNMYIRKKVFEKLGPLSVEGYLDDVELSLRMKENKYKVVFEPSAMSWEQEPQNIRDFYKQRNVWSRGGFKIKKLNKKKKAHRWATDLLHYTSLIVHGPFSLLLVSLMLISFFFGFQATTLLLTSSLFFYMFFVVVISKSFCGEPITDVLFFPHWIALNIINILTVPKAFFDEISQTKFTWHNIERK